MRRPATLLLIVALALAPVRAQTLPDLGDVSQSVFTPSMERELGDSIMQSIRIDRAFLEDAEVVDYLNDLGSRLVAASTEARQAFEFFAVDDPSVNAFALPGGFIGVHTGLLLTAQSESELAAVLAHEVAHVTQRHIARMISGQQTTGIATLAALALAILAARSNSQLGGALVTGVQAASVQSQLDYSRDFEREADRVGFQILEKSGLDPQAMPVFLERLQRASRLYESSAPSYLRTHPVTHQRIADLQNRAEPLAYRQVPDNPVFQMVRSKVRAAQGEPNEAVAFFEEALRERRFISEPATRYGLAVALLRARETARALEVANRLAEQRPDDPMVASLKGRAMVAVGNASGAVQYLGSAASRFPRARAILHEYADTLIRTGDAAKALDVLQAGGKAFPRDHRVLDLQARAYAAQGKRLLQHRSLAESYVLRGNDVAAIEQLEIGLRAGDGDFYQLSAAEARLRELRRRDEARRKRR